MKTMATQIKSKALFSDDGEHRLLLRREWDKSKKSAMIIMINPNTADTLSMDLTTMLTINNLTALGFGAVNIVNLYSRRKSYAARLLEFSFQERVYKEKYAF